MFPPGSGERRIQRHDLYSLANTCWLLPHALIVGRKKSETLLCKADFHNHIFSLNSAKQKGIPDF